MKDLTGLIARVKLGDKRAYEPIVRRFQDMAVAYGYATLGDWQLAEDAAQEAFHSTERGCDSVYIGTYSQNDISAFLGVPVSTVKMRLFHARKTLHAELVSEIETGLPERRPSRNSRFLEKTVSYEIQSKTVPAQVISMVRDLVY